MFILHFISFVVLVNAFDPSKVCKTSLQFRKTCRFYDFANDLCRPWALNNCEIIATKKQFAKCPIYDCSYFQSTSTTTASYPSTTTTTTPSTTTPTTTSTTTTTSTSSTTTSTTASTTTTSTTTPTTTSSSYRTSTANPLL